MNASILKRLGAIGLAAAMAGCTSSYYSDTASGRDPSPEEVAAMETMTLQQALADPESATPAPGVAPRPQLVPLGSPPIDDLPVPAGFRLKEALSRNYEAASTRFVDHTYYGRADKFSVVRFYGRQMPANGWTLRSSEMIRGAFTISYEKGSEQATVRVSDGKDNPFNANTTVSIGVHPVGAGDFRPAPVVKEE